MPSPPAQTQSHPIENFRATVLNRDGFKERGTIGHLSFGGPKQVSPIWPFVWKAWKYAPLMCSAS